MQGSYFLFVCSSVSNDQGSAGRGPLCGQRLRRRRIGDAPGRVLCQPETVVFLHD